VDPSKSAVLEKSEHMSEAIHNLEPKSETQRVLKYKAADLTEQLLQSRWNGLTGSKASVPLPFLTVLMLWLTFIFASFGLLAPRNLLVMVVQFVSALSVASAIFLILEMNSPFHGMIRVSSEPLEKAIERMNQ